MRTSDSAPLPLLVDRTTAAAMLSLSVRTIDYLVASGQLPSVKIGRARRFNVQSLRSWAAGRMEGE